LEHGLAETPLQVLAGEAPGEWFVESGVTLTEGHDAIGQLVEGGAVIGREDLPLENREVHLHQVNANAID